MIGGTVALLFTTVAEMIQSIIGCVILAVLAACVAIGNILHIKDHAVPSDKETKDAEVSEEAFDISH